MDILETRKITERRFDKPEALECYFKAKEELGKMSEEGLAKSLEELRKGMTIEGDNAFLYAYIGLIYFYYYETGIDNNQRNLKIAQDYAHKVLELDSSSSIGYFLLGAIERFQGNSYKAVEYFQHALKYDSMYLNALQYLCKMYSLQYGKPLHAESLIIKILDIDPMSPVNYVLLGLIQWMENKLDFAISSFKKATDINSDLVYLNLWHIYGLALSGLNEEAIDQVDLLVDEQTGQKKNSMFINWSKFFKYGLLGKKSKALRILDRETKDYFYNDPELIWLGICNFTLLNEIDEALDWLQRAINLGWKNYPLLTEKVPQLKNLHKEKKFEKLLETLKNDWENCEV